MTPSFWSSSAVEILMKCCSATVALLWVVIYKAILYGYPYKSEFKNHKNNECSLRSWGIPKWVELGMILFFYN